MKIRLFTNLKLPVESSFIQQFTENFRSKNPGWSQENLLTEYPGPLYVKMIERFIKEVCNFKLLSNRDI